MWILDPNGGVGSLARSRQIFHNRLVGDEDVKLMWYSKEGAREGVHAVCTKDRIARLSFPKDLQMEIRLLVTWSVHWADELGQPETRDGLTPLYL